MQAQPALAGGNGTWYGPANLGGSSYYAPRTYAFGAQPQVFISGSDGIYQKAENLSTGTWSSFTRVGPIAYDITSSPGMASPSSSEADAFVRANSGNNIYVTTYHSGSGWGGWTYLGGQTYYAPAPVVYRNQVQVFATGLNGDLYQKVRNSDGTWSSTWNDVIGGGSLLSGPAVVSPGYSVLRVFGLDANDHIIEATYQSGSGWSGWTSLGGTSYMDSVAAVVSDGYLEVFAAGGNNQLYENDQTIANNSGWSGWVLQSAALLGTGPAAALSIPGQVDVFYGGYSNYDTYELRWVPSARVGVYGFNGSGWSTTGINDGWPMLADQGALGTYYSPYTAEVGAAPDLDVVRAISSSPKHVEWLSYWTVSWPASGDTFYNAGYQGGRQAATTLVGYTGTFRPDYVVFDAEGHNTPPSSQSDYNAFLTGWADGLRSIDGGMQPAFYPNGQSQYSGYNLNSVGWTAIPPVTPILNNSPSASGINIGGFGGYYGYCPAQQYVDQENGWGAIRNTMQFYGSGVDCGP